MVRHTMEEVSDDESTEEAGASRVAMGILKSRKGLAPVNRAANTRIG